MEPSSDRDRMKEELKRELMESLQPVDLSRLGLLSKPPTAEEAEASPRAAEHGEHEPGHGGADLHEHMLTFPRFRREESGEIVEVDLGSIQGDTSDYGPTGDDDKGSSEKDSGSHDHGGQAHGHA